MNYSSEIPNKRLFGGHVPFFVVKSIENYCDEENGVNENGVNVDKNEISDLNGMTFDIASTFVDVKGKNIKVGDVVTYYNSYSSTWEPNYIVTDRCFKVTKNSHIIPFVGIRTISRIYSDDILKAEIIGSKIVSCDSIMLMEYTDEYKFLLDVITEVEEIDKNLSKEYDVDSEEYRKMRMLKVTDLLLNKQWCISLDKYFNKK